MAPPEAALDFVDFVNASPTLGDCAARKGGLRAHPGARLVGVDGQARRPVLVAGRVLVRDGGDEVVQRLVKIDRPLLRIPTLAIHLHRQSSFDPNKETELFPIAGLVEAELNKDDGGDNTTTAGNKGDGNKDGDFEPLTKMTDRHHPALLDVVAGELGVAVDAIADFELVLYDTQRAVVGGLADELIFAPRLDNLGMTYCAIEGLASSAGQGLDDDDAIRMAACFDHEEIGSESAQGAHSNLLPAVLRRLCALPIGNKGGNDESVAATAHEQTLARSFLISADMAHAVHPNYAAKYESSHQPALNRGTVIKVNANQRYATNAPGVVLVRECARLAGVPLQLFVVRNDSPCGTARGSPPCSAIRETGGAADVAHGVGLFRHFFGNYGRLEPKILVD
ncbi:hypothetical protein HIM_07704 [Hirsutella minnesotensis 3608]|uniref:aspartyl aminopeptidase n=1 Tax=Hirsutella minnesotensis 3608 TaxID=1043627 RepID=A0A0F7ZHN3_9HYPO|nr:hypothetical protein HIM_07704 [Hirsutella minnesotensis 3608]